MSEALLPKVAAGDGEAAAALMLALWAPWSIVPDGPEPLPTLAEQRSPLIEGATDVIEIAWATPEIAQYTAVTGDVVWSNERQAGFMLGRPAARRRPGLSGPMEDRLFTTEQLVPLRREKVFEFFSDPRNLEAITPPFLGFRIVDQTTAEIEEGTELTYRLRIHGLPATWRSKITEWTPDERFVDEQLKGPYAKWHHTHSFHDRDGGTLIRDRVLYRLPFGALGQLVAGRFVAADVRKIFDYRAVQTAELLSR